LPGAYPKNVFALADTVSEAGGRVELRGLVLLLLQIKTENDRLYWTKELEQWHQRHKDYLQQKSYNEKTGRYWYTHKLLRRSYLLSKELCRICFTTYLILKSHTPPMASRDSLAI
jgi:hypothetical protein